MLNIHECFELFRSNSWILTELWSEKFEWFGPSPIEPFNLGGLGASEEGRRQEGRRQEGRRQEGRRQGEGRYRQSQRQGERGDTGKGSGRKEEIKNA